MTVTARDEHRRGREFPGDDGPPHALPLVMMALGPFALGYFLSYVFRAVNAVVVATGVSSVVTQLLIAFPLYMLYEASIFIANRVYKQQEEEEKLMEM